MERRGKITNTEAKVLKLLCSANDMPVDRIAEEINKPFDDAFGYCLMLSDRGLTQQDELTFHVTHKGDVLARKTA
jgi:predicted transcriptional regulator